MPIFRAFENIVPSNKPDRIQRSPSYYERHIKNLMREGKISPYSGMSTESLDSIESGGEDALKPKDWQRWTHPVSLADTESGWQNNPENLRGGRRDKGKEALAGNLENRDSIEEGLVNKAVWEAIREEERSDVEKAKDIQYAQKWKWLEKNFAKIKEYLDKQKEIEYIKEYSEEAMIRDLLGTNGDQESVERIIEEYTKDKETIERSKKEVGLIGQRINGLADLDTKYAGQWVGKTIHEYHTQLTNQEDLYQEYKKEDRKSLISVSSMEQWKKEIDGAREKLERLREKFNLPDASSVGESPTQEQLTGKHIRQTQAYISVATDIGTRLRNPYVMNPYINPYMTYLADGGYSFSTPGLRKGIRAYPNNPLE